MDMCDSEGSEEFIGTPPEVRELVRDVNNELLPQKSGHRYKKEYDLFLAWLRNVGGEDINEKLILAYFVEKSKKLKAATLWPVYSMLKTMVILEKNVDISKFPKVLSFLKRKSVGYKPKKSSTFTRDEIANFLNGAPDELFLMMKVVLVLGVAGACRRDELTKMCLQDVEDHNLYLLIRVPDTKTNVERTFCVTGGPENWIQFYRKYIALRPTNVKSERLFLNYKNGKCTVQPVGVNKIGGIAKGIASYLKLPNPGSYTGHCFRRSSATLLVNKGADLLSLKRHGGWRSSAVAEGYIDDCIEAKIDISRKIGGCEDDRSDPCTSSSVSTSITKSLIPGVHLENCKSCTINITINQKE